MNIVVKSEEQFVNLARSFLLNCDFSHVGSYMTELLENFARLFLKDDFVDRFFLKAHGKIFDCLIHFFSIPFVIIVEILNTEIIPLYIFYYPYLLFCYFFELIFLFYFESCKAIDCFIENLNYESVKTCTADSYFDFRFLLFIWMLPFIWIIIVQPILNRFTVYLNFTNVFNQATFQQQQQQFQHGAGISVRS